MKQLKELIAIPIIFLVVWGAIQLYKAPAFSNGTVAPDFEANKANGELIQLSDFEGQLILLDFWGSWCGPCRQNNRSLVSIYNKYKNAKFQKESKFDIISIAMETNKDRWLAAIQKDGLTWSNHVSDIKRMNDHVAILYGVREIPTTYLLDGNRNIIGVNLTEQQMDEILTQRLQK